MVNLHHCEGLWLQTIVQSLAVMILAAPRNALSLPLKISNEDSS